ncbi:bifunctional UDP-N-acetylglucosamine diphosphorylase/glucosamine-1-phosphate N-acetyltransferase GlmU [Sneathiella limimaris]|uniref:bifunctional UDP-N-acetylglucosamine diphosphorylase/glucosamine-1-phosphate N-acetyltransferase GlmU n=1 Tax=Sneathiella limimaris TaxID=1964213 RepID=UPI00146DACC9|nr:bifunctional UDP-N-acetylglucosamine diphosphorylase/glucosamine-1-phosphate N-acetyltransferase GlmU [Sneathiella limimaris]
MTAVKSVILAAGMGSRMKSKKPKVLHALGGQPMISHLMGTVSKISAETPIVVISPDMADVAKVVAPAKTVVQPTAEGTGHAVSFALDELDGFAGTVLILYGDTPLISEETLTQMINVREGADNPAVVVLGFEPEDPLEYGRLVSSSDDELDAIVEFADASEQVRKSRLCNSGVMAIDGAVIRELIEAIGNDNAKGEYYLTDVVEIARKADRTCKFVIGDELELLGVNSRVQLAEAEKIIQRIWRLAAMDSGVTLIDPDTVFFSYDTELGQDVLVEPNVFFGPGVKVGAEARIKANSHLEGCHVGSGSQIGPFARLRPGANLGTDVKIGNFVEVKKSDLAEGVKVSHLSYIGDATIGSEANIGAGTITCNYDGYDKYQTTIGAGAFIGSNTALVAPVSVGKGAIVGAGSTVTKTVEDDALIVERANEVQKPGWASRFRALKARLKS